MSKFILASRSPQRLVLLEQIAIVPNLISPADIDETPRSGEAPRDYAGRLAREKVEIIAVSHQQDYVLAADTVVAVGRRILGKPEDAAQAKTFLRLLSGRRHKVFTAVAVKPPATTEISTRLVSTSVKFTRLDDMAIEAYLKRGEWRDKAGGYSIQGIAAQWVVHINGSYSAVVGLPLAETSRLLAGLGYRQGGKNS